MNKSLLLLTLISLSYAAAASARDHGFYAGLGVGRSSANVAEITRQDILDLGFTSLNSFQNGSSKSDTAWKVYGGYRFNPHVAAEAFYTNLGKFTRNATGSGVYASSTVNFTLDSALKVSGFGAAALLGAPLSDHWSVFAKPGLLYWDAKRSTTATAAGSSQSASTDKKGTSPTFGLGADYAFTGKLGARVEWERYFDVGDENTTGKSNVNLFLLSMRYTP
ncbi:MAG: outer membrane beta-barrel protein [Gammaproteobacteria bacterium]|jgi:OOP family OmpA-OmpF porin